MRAKNEDAVFADPALGLAILADGMGGYSAGEIASSMAVNLLAENLLRFMSSASFRDTASLSPDLLQHHLRGEIAAVNAEIFVASQNNVQWSGMGTTLVLAYLHNARLTVAHLGDSRLYRLRRGRFEQLTRDHSLLQEQLDSGMITPEEARFADNKNLVTRALGVERYINTEIHDYDTQAGDLLLLCSDGLNDMVDDADIAHTLQALSENLPLAADQLVDMANENGGRDNISVILIKVLGDCPAQHGWWQRLLARLG